MMILNTALTMEDRHRVAVINDSIPGWSGYAQYGFFKAALAENDIKRLLMLGVYMGRDLAFILDILHRYHPERVVELVGVDKFSDTPCDDWPKPILDLWHKFSGEMGTPVDREESLNQLRVKYAGDAEATRAIQDLSEHTTWRFAGFGEAPSVETATRNLGPFIVKAKARLSLYHSPDEVFLSQHSGEKYELAYLDTSHDYATVKRQIRQVQERGLLAAGGILCGDDYLAVNGWGVIQAVDEAFPARLIVENCIWVAP